MDQSFKTSANFHDFWPLTPYHWHSSKMFMKGIFYPYVLWPFDHWPMGTPLAPLRHADILNGWSLMEFLCEWLKLPKINRLKGNYILYFIWYIQWNCQFSTSKSFESVWSFFFYLIESYSSGVLFVKVIFWELQFLKRFIF